MEMNECLFILGGSLVGFFVLMAVICPPVYFLVVYTTQRQGRPNGLSRFFQRIDAEIEKLP